MTDQLKRILCIDDEPDILQIEKLTLESLGGFYVYPCNNGQDALVIARQEKPDLILLDVMMPGMDGQKTLAALQADPNISEIPVIFMTARARPDELMEYIQLGAIGTISKPFDPMTLCDEIRKLWSTAQ